MTDSSAILKLVFDIIQDQRARDPSRPALVGVGGAQGSGKSYVCALLEAANRPRFAHFSLHDVYLTRAERQALAREAHPLFITRGVPGTHDLNLADDTITALEDADGDTRTAIPRFDKARDDRAPESAWPVFKGQPEAIIVDGWCMGALYVDASSYDAPLNALEANEDADGAWRRAIEGALAADYFGFFDAFDAMIYLRAPSWEIVRRWRGEQEEKMLGRALTEAENAALDRFVMHYERVTRSMLDGHNRARWIVHLDEARNVVRVEDRG